MWVQVNCTQMFCSLFNFGGASFGQASPSFGQQGGDDDEGGGGDANAKQDDAAGGEGSKNK